MPSCHLRSRPALQSNRRPRSAGSGTSGGLAESSACTLLALPPRSKALQQEFGFTVDHIVATVKTLLQASKAA